MRRSRSICKDGVPGRDKRGALRRWASTPLAETALLSRRRRRNPKAAGRGEL
jgi:hypothetical protein